MDIAKTMIEAELISLRECYVAEKKALKIKIDEDANAAVKLRLWSRISLCNTRITVILESIEKLKKKTEERFVLKLNDWQIN